MKRLAILAIIVCAWFHLAPAHAQFNGCSSFCGTSSSAIADAPGFNNAQGSGSGSTLACTYTPVTSGTQNVAYTGATPSASGGVPAYTFSETGALPTGLSINTSTGVISGTPSVNGSFPGIQVKVTDTASTVVNCGVSFTLVISASFTTWNPADKAAAITLSNGNLTAASASGTFVAVRTIASHSTGKFYSSHVTSTSNNLVAMAICNGTYSLTTSPLATTNCIGIALTSGNVFLNSAGICAGVAINAGDVLDVAVDLGSLLQWYRVNGGAWQGNGGASPNPATGTNGCNISGIAAGPYFTTLGQATGSATSDTSNFGATAYTNAAPAGFGNW